MVQPPLPTRPDAPAESSPPPQERPTVRNSETCRRSVLRTRNNRLHPPKTYLRCKTTLPACARRSTSGGSNSTMPCSRHARSDLRQCLLERHFPFRRRCAVRSHLPVVPGSPVSLFPDVKTGRYEGAPSTPLRLGSRCQSAASTF